TMFTMKMDIYLYRLSQPIFPIPLSQSRMKMLSDPENYDFALISIAIRKLRARRSVIFGIIK
ncbi:hypothetical protein L9F63_017894, partial [Diploptera punctata]